ncbi:hypothetical protein P3G55_25755, partial [Leptospira sp. 96542]|nr:hypothetical protein [Leptospira sp. 96542]
MLITSRAGRFALPECAAAVLGALAAGVCGARLGAPSAENEVVSPEILKLTCGVLCNKQHQLFSQCKSSLETSCPNFVSC